MRFDMSMEVDNILPLAVSYEIMESQVRDLVDYCRSNYDNHVPIDVFEELLDKFDVADLSDLPHYLIEEIDSIDVY